MKPPFFIHLYNEDVDYDLSSISLYLKKETKIKVSIKKGLTRPIEGIAQAFAKARVVNVESQELNKNPLSLEIEYETKRLTDQKSYGILYDGFALQEIFASLIPKGERNLKHCHIIITKQVFGTYDEKDKSYHIRVSVYGYPSIISTSGIVEGPAKPREYYIKKRLGINEAILKEEFSGRFIDYGSPEIPEILKGYCLQAVFFHLTKDPFCDDINCRLYNSHWQEEMVYSQIKQGVLCEKHKAMLK